jgi:hypothetical protein
MGFSPNKLFGEPSQEYGVTVDKQAFKVMLHFSAALALGPWFQQPHTPEELETVDKILQCLNTLLVHAMSKNWIAVEQDPRTFFLKEGAIRELLRHGRGGSIFQQYYVSTYSSFVHGVCFNEDANLQ